MLQIAVLSNHLNGRDTHVRQIKVYGPRPYVSIYFLTNFLDIQLQYFSFLKHTLLQEPHSAATISIYFNRIHHLLYDKMTFYEGVNQASLVLNWRRLLTDWLYHAEILNQTTSHSDGKNISHWYQCQNMSSGNVAVSVPLAGTYSLVRFASGFIIGLDMALCFLLIYSLFRSASGL